jgi:hypothetical protein
MMVPVVAPAMMPPTGNEVFADDPVAVTVLTTAVPLSPKVEEGDVEDTG